MIQFNYPDYQPASGYMTDTIRAQYIESAIEQKLLPHNAHRMEHVISLNASNDLAKPVQFWQLYSILGAERIVAIVSRFYARVYSDENWFKSVFARIASMDRHINTQSAMWVDVMGGGRYYHGAEFRLNFHHTHNAIELMNDKGAERWVSLMTQTLNEPDIDYTSDPRVRPAINTFLSYFMGKYAAEFEFENRSLFGETNPPLKRRLNLLNMSSDQIEALSEQELIDELAARKIDVSQYPDKQSLVNKALSL
ncbi:hypothetical protein AB833_13535 [Chromatiales bacterium (ex Bugula neritina AB1)]|nr:hypothetical protein AB833_13535 [Chromatiales bacterium (ex Bugula neritina AB1)]